MPKVLGQIRKNVRQVNLTKKSSSKKEKLYAVSLFSGGGGLDLGLEAAGFSTVFATDKDDHSCLTLNYGKQEAARRGKPFLQEAFIERADITEVPAKYILEKCGKKRGEVALLAGGPPCQAFSVFGKRLGRQDPRGMLVFDYLRILAEIKPQAFVFENVYGLLTIEGGKVYQELVERLANPGRGVHYKISEHRVNAVDFGVPQFRDRVFIIGHLNGQKVDFIPPVTPDNEALLFGLKRRTVRDALRGLPHIGAEFPANHTGRVHSERIITRYSELLPGERDHHTRINKLDLDKPSFTIIVGSDKGGGKGHVHPIEPREVTPRESARIQTFPDWWAFSGTSRHPIRQIGNAVPPLLASAIGNELRSCLFGEDRIEFSSLLETLDQQHLFSGDKKEAFSYFARQDEKLMSMACA